MNILIDAEQLAKNLGIPKTWIYAAARNGRIPSYKLGKYRRFDEEAVREALDEIERVRRRKTRVGVVKLKAI